MRLYFVAHLIWDRAVTAERTRILRELDQLEPWVYVDDEVRAVVMNTREESPCTKTGATNGSGCSSSSVTEHSSASSGRSNDSQGGSDVVGST